MPEELGGIFPLVCACSAQSQLLSSVTATDRCKSDIETINLRSSAVASTTPLAPINGPATTETSVPGTMSRHAANGR